MPNAGLFLPDLSAVPTFDFLDIVCDPHFPIDLCSFLGPLSPLKKLVEFSSYSRFPIITQRFDACTITTLSISFRSIQFDSTQLEFITFINTFNLSKLEQLELTCAFIDGNYPKNLALIQSLSQEITTLQLIHTSGNKHLLTPLRQDGGWPSLSSLTVETYDDPSWLPPFLAARSGISTLTISPALLPIAQCITSPLGPNSTLDLRILFNGPSSSFAEFASPAHTGRFYYDDDHLGISDFEYTEVPFIISSRSFIHPTYWYGDGYSSYRDKLEENQEITEDWYAGNFSKIVAELARTKGALREKKRGNAKRKSSRRSSKGGRRHRKGCVLNLKEMFDSYM
ncbi:hypothetical protein R3P38DRAFT_3026309 [Favolaschia claudopus]|uniref:Uncharacterized protein n=1 Tax=Favolaschia claudopus TaxID=2862362 RepID=A0AAW0AEW5_9AGAR